MLCETLEVPTSLCWVLNVWVAKGEERLKSAASCISPEIQPRTWKAPVGDFVVLRPHEVELH